MIKFYQGTYDELSSAHRLESKNNICFVTDRHVLIMGGQEYGKNVDSVKVLPGLAKWDFNPNAEGGGTNGDEQLPGVDTNGVAFGAGTLVAFNGNDSLWRYNGGSGDNVWTKIYEGTVQASEFAVGNKADGTLSAAVSGVGVATVADIADAAINLEEKISGAYLSATAITRPNISDVNNIVVTRNDAANGGIVKTNYTLDVGAASAVILDTTTAAADKTSLSAVVPNAQTLAAVYEDVKSRSVTIDDSADKVITFSSASGLSGTTWTPELHIISGKNAESLVIDSDGKLQVKMAIRQKTTNTGYLATYALYNEAAGTDANAVQLGDDINLVKDQFIKAASYVKAIEDSSSTGGYLDLTETNYTKNKQKFLNAVNGSLPDPDTYTRFVELYGNKINRFLKLEFALTKTDNEPQDTNNDPDSPQTATDTDSVIYIDVNELFDSYTAGSGVAINDSLNKISGVVDPSTEKGFSGYVAGTSGMSRTSATYDGVKTKHYVDASGNPLPYLTVGENGFSVDGINQEIKAYIQDLSGSTSDANYKFLTGFGVDPSGLLTGSYAQASAQFVSFSGITAKAGKADDARVAVTGDNVDAALNSISNTIAKLDYVYDGENGGITEGSTRTPVGDTRTYYIYALTQTDGQVATSAKPLDGSDLQVSAFASPALSGTSKKIYTISDSGSGTGSLQSGLETIVSSTFDAIDALDLTQVGTSATLSSYRTDATTQTAYTIINSVSQADGLVYATGVALDADHVTFGGIGTTTSAGIALTGMVGNNNGNAVTVGAALSSIAAYIAQSDLATVGQVASVPGNVSNEDGNIYKVINEVGQVDGRVSATTMDLTAGNVAATAVAAVLPDGTSSNASVAPSAARVAVDGTNVKQQIDDISNTIADFMSFHDANDNVI